MYSSSSFLTEGDFYATEKEMVEYFRRQERKSQQE